MAQCVLDYMFPYKEKVISPIAATGMYELEGCAIEQKDRPD